MIYQNFDIDEYDWNIQVCYDVHEEDFSTLMTLVEHFYFNDKFNKIAYDNLSKNIENTGFTCTNRLLKHTLIVINKCSSKAELMNTIVHEARHLLSHIATVYNIDEKGEEVCYLIGGIIREMFSTFKRLL